MPSPLLVERQSIPAYKETPEHIHCDSFYILTPLSTQYKTDDDGVEDIRWFSIDEINALGDQCFPLLPRIIEKVFTTMRKI